MRVMYELPNQIKDFSQTKDVIDNDHSLQTSMRR